MKEDMRASFCPARWQFGPGLPLTASVPRVFPEDSPACSAVRVLPQGANGLGAVQATPRCCREGPAPGPGQPLRSALGKVLEEIVAAPAP